MATIIEDLGAAYEYIRQAKRRECYLPTPTAPEQFLDERQIGALIPYLAAAAGATDVQVYATGWSEIEGIMLVSPETEFDADLRVAVAANSERALRDLLFALPAGRTCFFYVAGEWALNALSSIMEGTVMPAREGYYAATASFKPQQDHPTRRLSQDDYDLVRTQWDQTAWSEVMGGGYCVHTCHVADELQALCFHWQIADWRDEVHGLQAVKNPTFAKNVISAATEEVISAGKVATCTANLASSVDDLNAFRAVGYQPFYRVHSFLGVKRGSENFRLPPSFYQGRSMPSNLILEKEPILGQGGVLEKSKDPLLTQITELAHVAGRQKHGQFVAEGLMLAERAIQDGLPINCLLYTSGLLRAPEGVVLLNAARVSGAAHFLVTEGMMGRVTATRPVPTVLAAIHGWLNVVDEKQDVRGNTLLIAEDINNPDNLGMLLRTADAAGVDGVLVSGERSDPYNKNSIRAARGAVGRLPIYFSPNLSAYLRHLRSEGFEIVGATLDADGDLYHFPMQPPIAIVVGNEFMGLSSEVLAACTRRVRIPMAPGQDSLNVGVAAGIMLYELVRQRSVIKELVA